MNSILQPIGDTLPHGEDTRYDDIYMTIESEIAKLTSVYETKVDWDFIETTSFELLTTKTKDLKLLTWWGYTVIQKNNLSQILELFRVINSALEIFGKNIFPTSNKAKLNAFIWFETIATPFLNERFNSLNDSDVLKFKETFLSMQSLIQNVCETETLLFRDLTNNLTNLEIVIANKQKQEDDKQQKIQQAKVDNLCDLTNDSDAIQILNETKKKIDQLSKYWRSKDVFDLKSIRFVRLLSWLDIDGVPPSQNGKTMINPPSVEKIEMIDNFIEDGLIDEAIENIENVLIRSPFWFAGHFKLYNIFIQSNKTLEAQIIKEMAKGILTVFNSLKDLQFKDGTPFVPLAMDDWFIESGTCEASNKKNNEFDFVAEVSYEFLRKKDPRQAIENIQNSLNRATSREEKFRWRLLQAQVASEGLKPQIALAIVDELESEIEQYKLTQWRPDLAVLVYTFVLQTFNRTQLTKERYEYIFNQLSRISPASAVEIKI